MRPNNTTIEYILGRFKPQIGADFERYRNHVYRVFKYCLLIDPDGHNEEKYAVAASFHDIGIWTDETFDYLNPSEHQARLYLTENEKEDWVEEVTTMIHFHHKITRYHGIHEITVETFRKADWIDISLRLITFGYSRKTINKTARRFPDHGFHTFLLKETTKNFFKHPFNPLPMVKK